MKTELQPNILEHTLPLFSMSGDDLWDSQIDFLEEHQNTCRNLESRIGENLIIKNAIEEGMTQEGDFSVSITEEKKIGIKYTL